MDPAVVAGRPPINVMIARYDQMQKRIRDMIDAELGPRPWRISRNGDQSTCGRGFENLDNVTQRYLPVWTFAGPIPDAEWPGVEQKVNTIAADYGFNTVNLRIDRPGYHSTSGTDTNLGAQYQLGSGGNTVMQVTTGCHRRD